MIGKRNAHFNNQLINEVHQEAERLGLRVTRGCYNDPDTRESVVVYHAFSRKATGHAHELVAGWSLFSENDLKTAHSYSEALKKLSEFKPSLL